MIVVKINDMGVKQQLEDLWNYIQIKRQLVLQSLPENEEQIRVDPIKKQVKTILNNEYVDIMNELKTIIDKL